MNNHKTQTLKAPSDDGWCNAFLGTHLSRIEVASENPTYMSTGDMLFDKAQTRLIWSAPTSKWLTIPKTVERIDPNAFVWSSDYKLRTLIFLGPPPELMNVVGGTSKMSCFDAKTGKIKTKSIKLTGVASEGEAVGELTVKGAATKTFAVEVE